MAANNAHIHQDQSASTTAQRHAGTFYCNWAITGLLMIAWGSSHAAFAGAIGEPDSTPQNRIAELQTTIAEMAAEAGGFEESRERILALPREEAIAAAVDGLATGVFQEPRVRGFAYRILTDLGAADSDVGFGQLLICLKEQPFAPLCAGALAQAPPNRLPVASQKIVELLVDDGRSSIPMIQALGEMGTAAAGSERALLDIYENDHFDARTRSAAAGALLRIIGPAETLEHFRDASQPVLRPLLGVVAAYIGETGERINDSTNKEYLRGRAVMLDWVLRLLYHEDREVRTIAWQTLNLSFGRDWIEFDADGSFRWNPAIRQTLERMKADHPDSEFRAMATSRLEEPLDAAAATVRRKMKRVESQAEAASPK